MIKRDMRIDALRGIAMIIILLNHFSDPAKLLFGFDGPKIPTPTNFGYSSAASIFVAMSGYMIGMVYLHREHPIAALTRRALKLYAVNFLLLLLVTPAAFLVDPAQETFWHLAPLRDDPIGAAVLFLTFRYAPAYLNILQLYVALLAMAPIAIFLVRRSPALLAACSLLLWGAMQVLPPLLYGPAAFGDTGPAFNVLAWQAAFFLPMIAGMKRWHEPIFAWFQNKPATLFFIILFVGLSAIARYRHLEWMLPFNDALTSRRFHAPIWTIHALLMLSAYAGLLAWLTPSMTWWPLRILASIGRNSLSVFAASVPITYLLLIVFDRLNPGYPGYLVSVLALLALSWLNAHWNDRQKRSRSVATGARPASLARSQTQAA